MSSICQLDDSSSRLLISSQHIVDPASLVKELIDNSLDAGATTVDVQVSPNATDLIQVKDNGHGVRPADVDLLARQACTSKISCYDDLALLGGRYLGFRGMALASIARLSSAMEIYTRVDTEPAGLRLHFSLQGEIIRRESQAGNPGTIVKVRDFLMFLPVRQQAVKKEFTKQLLKVKLLVQRYALARPGVHEAHQRSVVEATRNVFGSSLVSNCMLKHWSSRLGFVEREEPDLHMVDCEHYAITALLLKPDISFTKRNEQGQYCSVDFRPITSSKGTMKKIVAMYRRHLQQCLQAEIKTPFLCLNIMCPAGSYDPNIEPAKDDVLFTAEEQVLGVLERFFQAVYGKTIEDHATHQRTSINEHSASHPRPLVLLSQISNSTAVSDFSPNIDSHDITRPNEGEAQQETILLSPATSSATILDDRQSFVDISRLSADEDNGAEPDTQTPTDAEDSFRQVITDPFDAARISAIRRRLGVEKAPRDVADILGSDRERGQPISHNIARFEQSSKSSFIGGSASCTSDLSTRPTLLALNREISGIVGRHNGFVPSAIYPSTSKAPETTTPRGPLDTYFKPPTRNPIPNPSVNKAFCSMGTPLSDIPTYTGRKRKAPSNDAVEISEPASHTPTKRFNPNQDPTFASPQLRVSLTPNFSHLPHLPTNSYQTPTKHRLSAGLITPETSPLKQQPRLTPSATRPNIYLSQTQTLTTTKIKTPPTPPSTKKAPLRKETQHISPTTQNVKTSFTTLAKHDPYTAGKLDKQTTGFDLSELPDDKAEKVIRGCHRSVEELVSAKDDGEATGGVRGVRRGYDVDAGVEFELGNEAGFV